MRSVWPWGRGQGILRLVVGHGLGSVVVRVLLGSGLAIVAGRAIASILYDTSPRDPLVLFGVALLLCAGAVVASLLPGRHREDEATRHHRDCAAASSMLSVRRHASSVLALARRFEQG